MSDLDLSALKTAAAGQQVFGSATVLALVEYAERLLATVGRYVEAEREAIAVLVEFEDLSWDRGDPRKRIAARIRARSSEPAKAQPVIPGEEPWYRLTHAFDCTSFEQGLRIGCPCCVAFNAGASR